jgi:hypothetical protein
LILIPRELFGQSNATLLLVAFRKIRDNTLFVNKIKCLKIKKNLENKKELQKNLLQNPTGKKPWI